MQEGDVVLTPVPQADGTVKNRPAIVLREMPVYRDVLVCGVSTQLHQYVPGFDDLISPADADFASSGLPNPTGGWQSCSALAKLRLLCYAHC
jgi:mRNA interferase MazF